MTAISEANLRRAVSEIKDNRYSVLDRPGLQDQSEAVARCAAATRFEKLRHGAENRRKALELVASLGQAYTTTRLSTPFLIWALRDWFDATNILMDTHIEPGNNWAKIYSEYKREWDDGFWHQDELIFYFFWQNDTGQDAVVNVSSYLLLNGRCEVNAYAGWYWGGESTLHLDAQLSLLEWWNQPPTEPLWQRDQRQNVMTLSASSGWREISPGETKSKLVCDPYYLHYDLFWVPRGGAAVFEVSLNLGYSEVYQGRVMVDFNYDDYQVVCPYLDLEVLTEASRPVNA
jgi:hypothetical protein